MVTLQREQSREDTQARNKTARFARYKKERSGRGKQEKAKALSSNVITLQTGRIGHYKKRVKLNESNAIKRKRDQTPPDRARANGTPPALEGAGAGVEKNREIQTKQTF